MVSNRMPTREQRLAREWGMPEHLVPDWERIEPSQWAREHARKLYRAGLSAADAQELYQRAGSEVAASIGSLVTAAHMASLDPRWLHIWAASGLLRPVPNASTSASVPGRGRRSASTSTSVSFTQWVTEARRFIAAVEGDERLAALCAAAGLTPEEAASQFAAGTLVEEALQMLAGLRSVRDEPRL